MWGIWFLDSKNNIICQAEERKSINQSTMFSLPNFKCEKLKHDKK
jgi:hypothetical protein